jgi:adenylate cyclase
MIANPPDNTSIEAKIRQLSKQVTDMTAMLKAQRDLLEKRNIVLPLEPIDHLRSVATGLVQLADNLGEDDVEVQQLRELARTTEVINSSLDLDLILNDVIDTVTQLTKAERGYIVLVNEETRQLDFRVARNIDQRSLSSEEFIVSRTIVERVASQGEPIVTSNAEHDTRFTGSESIANYMLRSILCVPLKRKGEVKGVIYADNRVRPGLFSEREKSLVYAFANQATIAIENARLFENLRSTLAQITAMKDFMDNVLASIPSGVIATDGNDLVTTINSSAARILDLPLEAAVGKSLWDILPDLYAGFDALFAQVRERNREETIEVEPVIERRGQVNLNLHLSPLKDVANVTRGVTIVLDDLTELRQRQAQISAVRRYLPLVDNIKTIDELELGGVEREISVLYCDVRGFSTFSESLPPEELMTVINKYLTIASEAINLHEGIIDKYLGDAVVGLYNTQLNQHANHAERAVRSALAMINDVADLHELLPPEQCLLYGIGVHTGSAILGNVGSPRRKEFTVIGDTLQFAKTLQESAPGGEVLISEETYQQVRNIFEAELVEPRKAKSGDDYPPMYRVLGVRTVGA